MFKVSRRRHGSVGKSFRCARRTKLSHQVVCRSRFPGHLENRPLNRTPARSRPKAVTSPENAPKYQPVFGRQADPRIPARTSLGALWIPVVHHPPALRPLAFHSHRPNRPRLAWGAPIREGGLLCVHVLTARGFSPARRWQTWTRGSAGHNCKNRRFWCWE